MATSGQPPQTGLVQPRLRRLRNAAKPYGPEYEYKLAGLLALRARRNGLRFLIFTNVETARPWDDIVLRILEPQSYKSTVFIQLKHANVASTATIQAFTGPSGDFSLKKYLASFVEFKQLHAARASHPDADVRLLCECELDEVRLVMYTNRSVPRRRGAPDGPHLPFPSLLEDILCTGPSVNIPLSVFSFADVDTQIWQLPVGAALKDEYQLEFLPRLRVFSQQAHATELDALLREELDTVFGASLPCTERFLSGYGAFLRTWALDDNEDYALADSSGELEGLLVEELVARGTAAAGGGALVFRDVDCSVLRNRLLQTGPGVLHVHVDGVPPGLRAAKILQVLERERAQGPGWRWVYAGDRELREFPLAALEAACGACQVLVLDAESEATSASARALRAAAGAPAGAGLTAVVLLGAEDSAAPAPAQTQVLREEWRLEHLEDDAQGKLLDATVLFQGHALPLRALEGAWSELRRETGGALLAALVGEANAALGCAPPAPVSAPHPFLPRTLTHPSALDPDVLRSVDPRTHHFVLTGFPRPYLRRLARDLQDGDQIQRWTVHSYEDEVFQRGDELLSPGVHATHGACHVHWLQCRVHARGTSDQHLNVTWWRTEGDASVLAPFVLRASDACARAPTCVHTSIDAMAAWRGPALLIGEPGSGKTEFLKSLAAVARRREPARWAVVVQVLVYRRMIHAWPAPAELQMEHAVDLLAAAAGIAASTSAEASSGAEAARRCLEAALFHSGAIQVFVDGVDEVCPAFKDKLVRFLELLKGTKAQSIWVSTRPQVANDFREVLRCPPCVLRPFSKSEQKLFMCSHWAAVSNGDPSEFEPFALEVAEMIHRAAGRERSLLDMPLHMQMAAEVFETHADAARSTGRSQLTHADFSLPDLYKMFVERKRNVYKQRYGLDDPNFQNIAFVDTFDDVHQNCAMFVLVSNGVYDGIEPIHFKHYIKYLNNEKAGMLWKDDQGNPFFAHYSFVEFFAARWMLSEALDNAEVGRAIWRILLDEEAHPHPRYVRTMPKPYIVPDSSSSSIASGEASSVASSTASSSSVIVLADRDVGSGVRQMLEHLLTEGRPLHRAVLEDDKDALEAALATRDPDEVDAFGRAALHVAASLARADAVDALLAADADFERRDALMRWTPLRYCKDYQQMIAAERLLAEGADVADLRVDHVGHCMFMAAQENLPNVMRHLSTKVIIKTEETNLSEDDEWTDTSIRDDRGFHPLHTAAYMGHYNIVKILLDKGCDCNVRSNSDETPLMSAAGNGHKDCTELLLQRGADAAARDEDGCSSLHKAASNGHSQVVQLLLDSDADPNAINNLGCTPLRLAAESGDATCVELLLQQEGVDVNARGDLDATALHAAASGGHPEIVKLLLEQGADPNLSNGEGFTPLQLAVREGSAACVSLLLEHVACDNLGVELLHSAALHGHVEVVQLLLDKGVDVNASPESGSMALRVARVTNSEQCVQLLLQNGAVFPCGDDGVSPLHEAAYKGYVHVVELLLDQGADPNARTKTGGTPLDWACQGPSEACASLLLLRGADARARDDTGATPLHWAVSAGAQQIVELLLRSGADPNAQRADSSTPLRWATERGDAACVSLLLQHGADARVGDEDGDTPLHVAALYGHPHVVRVLLESGAADPDARNAAGETPLHWAAEGGFVKCAATLLELGADVAARDANGNSVLHPAAVGGNDKILRLLLERGADPDARNQKGESPLDCAVEKSHHACVLLLQDASAVSTA